MSSMHHYCRRVYFHGYYSISKFFETGVHVTGRCGTRQSMIYKETFSYPGTQNINDSLTNYSFFLFKKINLTVHF